MAAAAVLSYVRFFGNSGANEETIKSLGMAAVALCYAAIIAMALRDNMFDGLLCIVIPFYPFYYLFTVSGAVMMRALVGALLVSFGYDCALFLQHWSSRAVEEGNTLINRTGR